MVVLPAQKRKQQLLSAALVMIVVLIFIAWFTAFRILNPSQAPSPQGESSSTAGRGEEGVPSYAIPQLDWKFISLFGTYQLFQPFAGESTTPGRKNPFLPY